MTTHWIIILHMVTWINVESIYPDPDTRYCFNFTWLGAASGHTGETNATCDNTMYEVCKQPIYTGNLSKEALENLWHNHPEYHCIMPTNHVCAKWIYYYNGAVEYITYFCTRIIIDRHTAMTTGCLSEYVNGYEKRICSCQSNPGMFPCNSAERMSACSKKLLLVSLCLLLKAFVWS